MNKYGPYPSVCICQIPKNKQRILNWLVCCHLAFPPAPISRPSSGARSRAEVRSREAPGRCQGACAHLGTAGGWSALIFRLLIQCCGFSDMRLLTSFFRGGKAARNGPIFLDSGYPDSSPSPTDDSTWKVETDPYSGGKVCSEGPQAGAGWAWRRGGVRPRS